MNFITDWLNKNDRSLAWLARKTGISKMRLHHNYKKPNKELYKLFTLEERDRLNEVMNIDIEEELRR